MGVVNFEFNNDKYNLEKKRNKDNTSRWDYNCGGYALGTYSWYCPAKEETDDDYDCIVYGDCEEFFDEEEREHITNICINAMLEDFKDSLRVINDIKELKENEYAIAFRVSGECDDFHYCKRDKRGHWTHKMGSRNIEKIKKEDVFAPYWLNSWGEKYVGRIVLFAKKD